MAPGEEKQGRRFKTLLLQRGCTSIKSVAHQWMTSHIDFSVECPFKQIDQMLGLSLETHFFKKAELLISD